MTSLSQSTQKVNRFQIEDEIELEMQVKNLPAMITLSPQSDKYSEKLSHKSAVIQTGKSANANHDFDIANESSSQVHETNSKLQIEIHRLNQIIEKMKLDHITVVSNLDLQISHLNSSDQILRNRILENESQQQSLLQKNAELTQSLLQISELEQQGKQEVFRVSKVVLDLEKKLGEFEAKNRTIEAESTEISHINLISTSQRKNNILQEQSQSLSNMERDKTPTRQLFPQLDKLPKDPSDSDQNLYKAIETYKCLLESKEAMIREKAEEILRLGVELYASLDQTSASRSEVILLKEQIEDLLKQIDGLKTERNDLLQIKTENSHLKSSTALLEIELKQLLEKPEGKSVGFQTEDALELHGDKILINQSQTQPNQSTLLDKNHSALNEDKKKLESAITKLTNQNSILQKKVEFFEASKNSENQSTTIVEQEAKIHELILELKSKELKIHNLEAQILEVAHGSQEDLVVENLNLKEQLQTIKSETNHKEQDQRNLIAELKGQIEQLNRDLARRGGIGLGNNISIGDEVKDSDISDLQKKLEDQSFKNEVLQLEINKLTEKHILKEQEHEAQLKI